MLNLLRNLYFQVIVAIVIGILLGHFYPDLAVSFKPLGDAFIKLIKMLIAPIIFTTVVVGIAGMGDMSKLGRVGGKTLLYFEVVTTLALVIGLIVVKVIVPGEGINADVSKLDMKEVERYTNAAAHQSTTDFFMNIIPNTFVDAFAKGEILQVLLISILLGVALAKAGKSASPLVSALDQISHAFLYVISLIMKLAPVAAFGAMAFTIGKFGLSTLLSLGKLMLAVYTTSFLFIALALGSICYYNGISLWKLIKAIREEIFIVLGTSSSESVLPKMMTRMEELGCAKPIVGIVLPSGYSFNLDGTCIYLTMAAIFIAQATNTPLTLGQELTVLLVLLLTSKGAAAVTGGGFITLAATLAAIGTVPVAGITLVLGVDRFMSEIRSITNLIGNAVATVVMAKWEGELNLEKAAPILRSPETPVVSRQTAALREPELEQEQR